MRFDINLRICQADVEGTLLLLQSINETAKQLQIQILILKDDIMTAISEFAAKQQEFHTRMDAAVAAIQADIEGLNAKIVELQNTTGAITVQDQALLDDLQARGEAMSTKIDALNAMTPPATPPEPPVQPA